MLIILSSISGVRAGQIVELQIYKIYKDELSVTKPKKKSTLLLTLVKFSQIFFSVLKKNQSFMMNLNSVGRYRINGLFDNFSTGTIKYQSLK